MYVLALTLNLVHIEYNEYITWIKQKAPRENRPIHPNQQHQKPYFKVTIIKNEALNTID